MDYWVIHVTTKHNKQGYVQGFLYATPLQAETSLSHMYRDPDSIYAVRPATWQEREERMFTNDVYEQPVWAQERFWLDHGCYLQEHYVHISTADPSSIAFTEDARKGEADRQTLMKPGKYLQKFLGSSADGTIEAGPLKGRPGILSKMQVAYYASWHKAGKRPPSDDVLHFTDDPKEMVRVYREGPYSCMRGCDKDWEDDVHPIQIYAGGSLQMAYMTNVSNDVLGRALCWPEKQVFGRVYPTPGEQRSQELYDELMARLKALGWTSINEDNTVFEGALLRYMTNRWGAALMPYLDHEYGVEEVYRDGTRWWKMTHSESHQDNTDGTYTGGDDDENDDDWMCDQCEEYQSENYNSYAVYRAWHPTENGRGYPVGERTWCSGCREYSAFYCDGSDESYSGDDNVEIVGSTYESNWAIANGAWQSSWSDEWFFKTDDPPVTLANGQMVTEEDVEEGAAFRCLADGQLWPRDFNSVAVPGYSCVWDLMTQHPIEVELTLPDFLVHPDDVAAWATACDVAGHAYSPSPFALAQRMAAEADILLTIIAA